MFPDNNVNYAELYQREIIEGYRENLLSDGLTSQKVQFTGANTIRVPYITLPG